MADVRSLSLWSCLAWLAVMLGPHGVAAATSFESELAGWRLQQFLSLADEAFGTPLRTLDEPGRKLRAYRVGNDAYMVFGQDLAQPANIGSLQLTGTTAPGLGFRGLALGDPRDKVIATLGEPTEHRHSRPRHHAPVIR